MSFSLAFLDQEPNVPIEQKIAQQLERLLESTSPEQIVGAEFSNIQTSNLCFGLQMNWALGNNNQNKMIRFSLQQQLSRFEPRVLAISDVDIYEDDQNNAVGFFINAHVYSENGVKVISIERKMSRMNHYVPVNV